MKQFETAMAMPEPEPWDDLQAASLDAYLLERPALLLSFIDLAERFTDSAEGA